MEHIVSSHTKMFLLPCTITSISHSNPQTKVELIVDGDTVHSSEEAGITRFNVLGDSGTSLFNGIKVHEWFKVVAIDAHARVITTEHEFEKDQS